MITFADLLLIWIATIIISYGIQISISLNVFKLIADNGYKIDTKKLNQINNILPEEIKKNNLLTMLTPGINVIKSMENYLKIVNQSHILIDELRVFEILSKMTDEEIAEYQKKPTAFNALLVMAKDNTLSETTCSIDFDDGSKITYVIEDNLRDIKSIKSTTGPISQLNEEEQKAKIIEKLEKMANSETQNIEIEKLTQNKNQTNNRIEKIKEKKQKLEELKQEIMSYDEKVQKEKSSSKTLFRKKEK